ncbi:MAG: hypothetical protein HYV16_08375 [Gammaproteobacteria bacterium]|nr:hypothetical protein [Gammaproteobacteria bacterium]
MKAPSMFKLTAAATLLFGATVYAAPCKMNETEYKPFDEQRVLAKTEKSCPTTLQSERYAEESEQEDEEVSWADWAFDSHQLPSFHFIDLLELLGIG